MERIGILKISSAFLDSVLGLRKAGFGAGGGGFDVDKNEFYLYLTHPDMPETSEGYCLPEIFGKATTENGVLVNINYEAVADDGSRTALGVEAEHAE